MRKLVDRGIDWVGAVPENWQFKKGKYLFQQRSERGNTIALQLLSPTQKFGCIPQELYEELTGANAVKLNEKTDLNLLKTIHCGDFCISLRSFQGGFEYSTYEGVVSPAYQVFYPLHDNVYRDYYKYMFKDGAFINKMNSFTLSLRDGKNIAFADFGNTLLPLPSVAEQRVIADYLDKKTSEIDAAIKEAQELIEKYKAYKQSVITEAVTKGLDPQVPMKDSGVEWIGEIPEGWNKCRLKYLCEITTGNEDTQNADPDGEYPFYVRSPLIERCKRYTFDGEGILIAGDGAGAGRIFHHVFGKYAVHQRVYRLYNFKITTSYLHYYLSSIFPNEMDRGSAQSTVPSMRLPMLLNFNILIPSNSEQQSIANYLDNKCAQIDSVISEKENLITQLQEYKKSIIFEYVIGKKEVPNG